MKIVGWVEGAELLGCVAGPTSSAFGAGLATGGAMVICGDALDASMALLRLVSWKEKITPAAIVATNSPITARLTRRWVRLMRTSVFARVLAARCGLHVEQQATSSPQQAGYFCSITFDA